MNVILYDEKNIICKKVACNLFNKRDFFTDIKSTDSIGELDLETFDNVVYIYKNEENYKPDSLMALTNKNIILVEIDKKDDTLKDELVKEISKENHYINTYNFKSDDLNKENKLLYKHTKESLFDYMKESEKPLTKKKMATNMIWLISFTVILAVVVLGSILISKIGMPVSTTLKAIFKPDGSNWSNIIWYDRLPRVLGGALIGAILALSGVVLKVVMRNDLAGPSIIGVNSGASLAAHIFVIAFPALAWFLPIGAFLGSFLTTVLIYFMAYKKGASPSRLVLAGVAVTSIYSAFIALIRVLNPDAVGKLVGFGAGQLKGISMKTDIPVLFPVFLISFVLLMIFSKRINIMMLGDEMATALGLRVELFRWFLIILSSLLASISIAMAGIIAFVGLIIPHIARLIVGSDYRFLVPTSAVLGAILLVVSDTIGRVILREGELPVGIIVSFIGAPFFLFLLRRKQAG